jgi:chromosome segregation ATPase
MHDVVVVGIPLLAILGGLLFNNQALARVETRLDGRLDRLENNFKDCRGEIRDVRTEIKDFRGEIRNEIKDIGSDLTNLRSEMHHEFEQFYRTLGQHDARIDNLEKQRQ